MSERKAADSSTLAAIRDWAKALFYKKPSSGIPENDLSLGVQQKLNAGAPTIDSELSSSSTNPVQNKVVKGAIDIASTKAGSSNSTGKLYLIGAGSQSSDGVETNSHSDVYMQAGELYASKSHNAVWNDFADLIDVNRDLNLTYGCCYCFDGVSYHKSSKYLDDGIIGIHSDTAGIFVGHKEGTTQMAVSVAGFVLAYVDKVYPPGTPLTCTKDGYLTEMLREDVRNFPEKLIGTFWRMEEGQVWGPYGKEIDVDGRHWVKIR